MALREVSQQNIINQMNKANRQDPFKLSQYKNVQSKVKETLYKQEEREELKPNMDELGDSAAKRMRRSSSI